MKTKGLFKKYVAQEGRRSGSTKKVTKLTLKGEGVGSTKKATKLTLKGEGIIKRRCHSPEFFLCLLLSWNSIFPLLTADGVLIISHYAVMKTTPRGASER